jgi:hypothetical protein
VTTIRFFNPRCELEHGALAGAVGAEHEGQAGAQVEIQRLQNGLGAPVRKVNIVKSNHDSLHERGSPMASW